MRKRNNRIKFRLTEKEAERLNGRVKKSGQSREACIRQLISTLDSGETLTPDFTYMAERFHAIGTELNHIAQKTHVLNVIDVQHYNDATADLKLTTSEVLEAVMQMRRLDCSVKKEG